MTTAYWTAEFMKSSVSIFVSSPSSRETTEVAGVRPALDWTFHQHQRDSMVPIGDGRLLGCGTRFKV